MKPRIKLVPAPPGALDRLWQWLLGPPDQSNGPDEIRPHRGQRDLETPASDRSAEPRCDNSTNKADGEE
jgi:hypothetical protein